MIVQNSAIRLYRVLKESQLLKQIRGIWYTPIANNLSLSVLIHSNVKTMLHDLATRVPANSPCIKAFSKISQGVPKWGRRVHSIPKQKDWDYEVITNTLTAACQNDSLVNIFCDRVQSNKDQNDGKQLGATLVVLYQGGRERWHKERVLGETVTDSDTLLHSLHAGFDALTHFLENITMEPSNFVTLALPFRVAVNRALDVFSHKDQEMSILIPWLRRLGIILESYPNTDIVIIWLPRDTPFEGFQRAKELALDAIHIVNPTNIITL